MQLGLGQSFIVSGGLPGFVPLASWEADSGLTSGTVGQPVSSWVSGAYDLAQGTAGNRPTHVAAFAAITPHDTNMFKRPTRGIYVGGDGDIVAVRMNGTAVTFAGAKAGTILPIAAAHVNNTSTTATGLVALW